jgi:hypothetical protein
MRGMRRISLAAALAVLSVGWWSAPAQAQQQVNQTLTFDIVGAGHIAGNGIDCSRAPGGPLVGDCAQEADTGAPDCNPDDPNDCIPTAHLRFEAQPAAGFRFTAWSHPQCPNALNPCDPRVAVGEGLPPLNVIATFVDVAAPTAALTAPAGGAAVRGTIALTATATDNAGSPRVVFRVRGNPLPQTFEVPPYTLNFDTTALADGPAAISATATDAAGLSSASTANVTIDNTNPTLTVTGPDGQTIGPATVPTWTLAAADATTAITVQCSVVGVGQPAAFHACTGATQERLPNQPDGRYTLTVRATDAAGNFVEQTRAFGIDSGPPETTIGAGPGDGSTTTATSLTWASRPARPRRSSAGCS